MARKLNLRNLRENPSAVYLTYSEAAELLNVSERTVMRWVLAGSLRSYKEGRIRRIPADAVIALGAPTTAA